MNLDILPLFWVLSILTNAALAHYRRVCYYTNWAQYRPGNGKFFPEDIPPHLCTHLVFAFATMEGNKLKAFEWNDEGSYKKGMYERFCDLKKQNPSLKTLLAVGGWNFGTSKMTAMLSSAYNRQEFIKTSIEFVRKRHFDGLDLDFEYPGARGSPADDKWKFARLVQEFRRAIHLESSRTGRAPLLLTAAVPAGKKNIDNGYDIPKVCRHLDFISVMTYDFHGKWEKVTGHNSPLYAANGAHGDGRFLNMDFAASYWLQNGCDKGKMNIGLPLYGRSFTLSSPQNSGLGAPAPKGGKKGKFTREAGYLAYYEVCEMQRQGAHRYWLDDQKAPYCVKGDQWVGFDDQESLGIKVDWIKRQGFGGIMVWALDLDDFKGTCSRTKYPLMSAINARLGVSGGSSYGGGGSYGGGFGHNPPPPKSYGPPPPPPVQKYDNSYQPGGPPPSLHENKYNKPQLPPPPPHVYKPKNQYHGNAINQPGRGRGFSCAGLIDGYFRHAKYCDVFYQCHNGLASKQTCPAGTVFSTKSNVCQFGGHETCMSTYNHLSPHTNVFYPNVDSPPRQKSDFSDYSFLDYDYGNDISDFPLYDQGVPESQRFVNRNNARQAPPPKEYIRRYKVPPPKENDFYRQDALQPPPSPKQRNAYGPRPSPLGVRKITYFDIEGEKQTYRIFMYK